MRKLRLALVLASFALALSASADTITLKDGTVIQGTITQQDDTQVTVNYNVSDTISDTKIIKLTDIAKIEKPTEDSIAFESIKNLRPDPWQGLAPDAYNGVIGTLKSFLTKYPQSPNAKDVQAILDVFVSEQSHAQAGDVKLFGRWVPAKEAAARGTEVQEQALYLQMQASANQGDLVGALNAFDKLEKAYPGSRLYPAAIPEAQALADKLASYVTSASATLQVNDAKWKQGVAITPEPEKSIMIASHNNELVQADALLDTARKSLVKWPPLIPNSQKSLDALSKVVVSEKARMLNLQVDKMNASITESDQAAQAIAAGDLATADSHLKTATTLWPTSEEADIDSKAIDTLKLAQKNAGKPTPAPSRTPAKLVASNTTASATPAGSPKPSRTPVTAASPDSSNAGSTPATSDNTSNGDGNGGAKQSLIDFVFTIPGAVTIVVCAIGLFALTSFMQKSKRKREEAAERAERAEEQNEG